MKHTEYTRLKLTQELTFEANYSKHSTPCKWFKLTMGNKSTTMSRDELFGLLFLFADEQQQEDLIPIKETKVRSITRLLSFKLKKDMRKGEIVRAAYTYFMPETIVEKLLISNPEKYRKGELKSESQLEKHVNKII